jgi:hypothetical protein
MFKDKEFRFFNVFFFLIVGIVVVSLLFRVYFVGSAIKMDKPLYEISVNKFGEVESYLTSKYHLDSTTNCITFKDELGIKRVVCGLYTISTYNE